MILLNCAFNKKIGKKPIYETFDNYIGSENFKGFGGLFISIFIIFIVILAVILAVRCNPNNQFKDALIAFMFSSPSSSTFSELQDVVVNPTPPPVHLLD